MHSFLKDISFGLRMLLKNPGFTFVAVLSLAVGIGINSTVFGFVNAIFFKPPSVSNSEGLVYVVAGDRRNPYRTSSYYAYTEFRQQNDVFSGLAAYAAPPMLMTKGEHTEEISSEVVSENYFSVLDVHLQRGSGFTVAHEQLSNPELSVVISDSFWKHRLNSEPDILGKQLILNGNSFSVVGVAPSTFTGMDPTVSTDVWVPITQWATLIQKVPTTTPTIGSVPESDIKEQQTPTTKTEASAQSTNSGRLGNEESWLSMIGRLKPGVPLEQAEAVMATIATRLPRSDANSKEPMTVSLSPADSVHPAIQEEMPAALLIIAVASLILMICCVNVASLMLSRAAARQKEFAIRIALGSTRKRFVRQLLTEALLLSLAGGILGLLFAYWTTRIVLGLIPPGDLGLSAGIAIDQRVLGFSFAISLLTALIFGLMPALNSFRPNLVQSLGAEGMSLGGKRRKINLRRALVVIQIVTSFVLLSSGGLFLRSFQRGRAITQDLMSDRMLVLDLSPKKYGYETQYSKAFYRQLLLRIGALPGVESATLSNVVPLTMQRSTTFVTIDGREPQSLQRSVVAEGYFKTLNMGMLRGREFDVTDDNTSRKVVIINETMARTFWPDENPLGKRLQMGRAAYEIIGVVKNSPYNGLGTAPGPYIYAWLYQRPDDENVSLIVRTSAPPETMVTAIQRDIKELGGNLPIFDFKTLEDLSKSQLVLVRAAALLLSLLSLIGLIVASIGIYGVTTYVFSQRRREIGIRVAFGAQRSDVLKLIMKEGVLLATVGITMGVLLAWGTTRFVSGFLYGVSPLDPLVFFGVAALLSMVALIASVVPAIVAVKANPMDSLRYY